MRLFIAIDPPGAIQEALRPVQERLAETRAEVRWVAPGNYHITVKFLGEVEASLTAEIAARLERAAAEVPVFPLEVEGIGKFPARGQPRVIMAAVRSPDQRLTKLHRLIDSGVGGMGLTMDNRPLVAHLTLGRVSSNHGINRLLRLLPKHEFDSFGSFEVGTVSLYRSTPGAEGATYEKLHTAMLKGSESLLGSVGEGEREGPGKSEKETGSP